MNTTISFHNIKNIEVKETQSFPKDKHSKAFFTRHILITDEAGNTSEITFFSDDKSVLKIV